MGVKSLPANNQGHYGATTGPAMQMQAIAREQGQLDLAGDPMLLRGLI